ncbi:GNAT family protein [Microbacterium oryzae]|uniref:N-acetyltransferase n=1 Tax=Microbacterium oryzae TaxID=743009 RepID=A0A6I6DNS7_9MICO|nr:GNAT family protein [Microbacterium oryzae]QGU26505.1 N-acetyltransferase [Microbacterium oryzae]
MDFAATPVLENDFVRLEPLRPAHSDDLAAAVAVDDLWRTWYTRIPAPERMAEEIVRRLAEQEAGRMAPWAIVDAASGRAVGMTTYLHIEPDHRRLEIGSTWIGTAAQGTGINPAAKLLLLERAFDVLGCICVQLCTHWHNHQSRAAIARLGAKQDGVLRSHAIFPDGHVRDTVMFSIIEPEWPAVRRGLEARLARRGAA